MVRQWNGCDFGRGLFYQASAVGGIPGQRDTAARAAMLADLIDLDGQSLLDLGCNTGFLTCDLARRGAVCVGIDHNRFLVEMAVAYAHHFGVVAQFSVGNIAEFCRSTNSRFDIVLLLSSHITNDDVRWDQAVDNIRAAISVMTPDGVMVFEDHPSFIESRGPGLFRVLGEIGRHLELLRKVPISSGYSMDRGRTLYLFRARS
jgi:SAM-dependent methyltransferase